MPFTPKNWVDETDPLGVLEGTIPPISTTPLTAAALEDLEERVTDYADSIVGVSNPGDVVFVSPSGNDASDGLSWDSPLLTIEAAIAATSTGEIRLGPGTYTPSGPMTLTSQRIIGHAAHRGSGAIAQIVKSFNGDLFTATATDGGGIENVSFDTNVANTGCLIRLNSTAETICGYWYFRNLVMTGTVGSDYNVILYGAPNAWGIRSIWFENCQFFGATSGYNIYIDKGVHIFFSNCELVMAPTAVQQQFGVYDAFSEDINFSGDMVGADIYTEASGLGCTWVGHFNGDITCAVGSDNNLFVGICNGTFTNSGGASNALVDGGTTALSVKLEGDFLTATSPNQGQVMIAPTASTSPAGVAQITLLPNDATANLQNKTALIAFHPERSDVEDATIKCHRHVDGSEVVTMRHIQIHTKNAAGTDLTSRLEIDYLTDDAPILITTAHLTFDANAYIKTKSTGLPIKGSDGAENFKFEDSGVLAVSDAGVYSTTATAGGVHTVPATARTYWVVRDSGGTLRKIALFDA